MITDFDLRLIREDIQALIGTEIGQYDRTSPAGAEPAIWCGRKPPGDCKVKMSGQHLARGAKPVPALEVIFDRYAPLEARIRNIGSPPAIEAIQLFLIFHDDRQRSDLIIQKLRNRYNVPADKIDYLPPSGQSPAQYRLEIIDWRRK